MNTEYYIEKVDVITINLNMVDYMKSRCEDGIPDITDFADQAYEYMDEIRKKIRQSKSEYLRRNVKIQFAIPHLDMQLRELVEIQMKAAMEKIYKDDMNEIFIMVDDFSDEVVDVVSDLILDENLQIGFGMDYSRGIGYRCIIKAMMETDPDECNSAGAIIVFYGTEDECDIPYGYSVRMIPNTEYMIPDSEPILTDNRPSDFRKLKTATSFGEILPSIDRCPVTLYAVNIDEFPAENYRGQDTDWGLDDTMEDIAEITNELSEIDDADIRGSIVFYGISDLAMEILHSNKKDKNVDQLANDIQDLLYSYIDQKRGGPENER